MKIQKLWRFTNDALWNKCQHGVNYFLFPRDNSNLPETNSPVRCKHRTARNLLRVFLFPSFFSPSFLPSSLPFLSFASFRFSSRKCEARACGLLIRHKVTVFSLTRERRRRGTRTLWIYRSPRLERDATFSKIDLRLRSYVQKPGWARGAFSKRSIENVPYKLWRLCSSSSSSSSSRTCMFHFVLFLTLIEPEI